MLGTTVGDQKVCLTSCLSVCLSVVCLSDLFCFTSVGFTSVGFTSVGFTAITRKSRILDVVYNASNNELVRTKTLVKNCIVQVDSTPFRQWFEAHYSVPLGRKKAALKELVS